MLAAGLSQLAHVAVGAPLTTMKKPQQQKAKGAVEKGFQQGTNLMMPPPTTARLSGWLNATPQQVENAARRPVVTPLTDVVTLGGADAAATPLSAVCKPEDATASIPATATTTFAHTTPGTHLSNNLRNDDDSNFVNDTPFSPPAAPPAFAADDAHAAAVAALLAASPGTAMAADILASAIGSWEQLRSTPGQAGFSGQAGAAGDDDAGAEKEQLYSRFAAAATPRAGKAGGSAAAPGGKTTTTSSGGTKRKAKLTSPKLSGVEKNNSKSAAAKPSAKPAASPPPALSPPTAMRAPSILS